MASADHSQFPFAAERYVLDELPEEEKLAFEEHFFSCASCAKSVEDLMAIRAAAPVVLPELERASQRTPGERRRNWFALPWAPQLALGAMALLVVITGYQNVVEIPRLAAAANESLQLTSAPPVLTARRAAGALVFSGPERRVPLLIKNEWPAEYDRYRVEVVRLSSKEALMHTEEPVAQGSLLVFIPARKLGEGDYELRISGLAGQAAKNVANYRFSIRGE